jgi:hypothetical protein
MSLPVSPLPSALHLAYREALAVQDACNLSGVLASWFTHLQTIREEADRLQEGSNWIHVHPINILFASKVASLTGCDLPTRFHAAYQHVTDRIAALPPA